MARKVSIERLVDGLDGSDEAKLRLKAILTNLAGACSVGEAGESVGIGEAMFHRERADALQGALEALEPKPDGRPAHPASPEEERLRALEDENQRLRLEIAAARIREELAVAMPHLLVRGKKPRPKKVEAVGAEPANAPTATPIQGGHETRHRERLLEACRLRGLEKKPRCARGWMMQDDRRRNERDIRKAVVAFGKWAASRGQSGCAAARLLGIADATIRAWNESWKRSHLKAGERGAPSKYPDALTRTAVLVVFYVMGPGVGVATVQQLFPDVTRGAIENLLRRYRRMAARRKRRLIRALLWKRAGATWAMDYTEAPVSIDGKYPWCLAVRDLASGEMLCALPVTHATAAQTRATLEDLFRRCGVPLVIKSDNGSHFTGGGVPEFLEAHGVTMLLSPPGLPPYNGAIEAGIGSLKTRAQHLSTRHGRPGQWTCDDIEGARLEANCTGRPRGLAGSTPDEAWREKTPVIPEERIQFARDLARMRETIRFEQGYLFRVGPMDETTHRAHERMAVVRTLLERGYLEIRRSRIPLLPQVAVRA